MSSEVRRAMGFMYGAILVAVFFAFRGSGAAGIATVLVFLNSIVLVTMIGVGRRNRRRSAESTAKSSPAPEDFTQAAPVAPGRAGTPRAGSGAPWTNYRGPKNLSDD